jgi:hypothetical protein
MQWLIVLRKTTDSLLVVYPFFHVGRTTLFRRWKSIQSSLLMAKAIVRNCYTVSITAKIFENLLWTTKWLLRVRNPWLIFDDFNKL